MRPDLVVLGNLLVDDVVYPDGRTRMGQAGGAVLYAALGAWLWGARVGLAAPLGSDYPPSVPRALAERGIDLGGVRRLDAPGLRTWLLYEDRRRRVVHRLDGPSHAEMSPTADDLPPSWRGSGCLLAPMPFAVQATLLEALATGGAALLAVDPYELLTEASLPAWREAYGRADLLFFSEDEMEIADGQEDPRPVLERLAEGRLERLFYKQGALGGVVYERTAGRFLEWDSRAERVVDPTGAGDAFAGGVLAGLLGGGAVEEALRRGVIAASFALEGAGADGLLAASPAAAAARLDEWFGR